MKKIINKAYKKAIKPFIGTGLSKKFPFKQINKLMRKNFQPDILDFHGHKIMTDKVDSLGLSVNPDYEKTEIEFTKKIIKKGYKVLDIGANIGTHTIILAELVGEEGEVIAIEPDPYNFELLLKNVELNKYEDRVKLIQAAGSNKEETISLYINEENRGDHRLYDTGEERKKIDVKTIIIGELFRDNEKIDYIKIDVQGAEQFVLEGMKKILEQPQIKILLEFWPYGLKGMGSEPEKLIDYLTGYGFTLQELGEETGELHKITKEEILKKCEGKKYVNLYLTKEQKTQEETN